MHGYRFDDSKRYRLENCYAKVNAKVNKRN